ncbi:uncharacterized protein KQ657_001706 [Scheffersomyces spartinae]|uniref:Phosphatidic acid phosphatase type 2/haloperoxidase domain-containing protein n=1 Tax=Scheffersomyces spartinae TaxID=45513 RepID=A0A9P7V823_9ASCO|nr:uncharacterized protein KQ657_001706 [Scheffersomyces spartinae]KAG7192606.1 hypothetical protein KQ657_001706 [Scheffersomyces spartinae]
MRLCDILLILALIGTTIGIWHLSPFERQFIISDPTINHPFAEHERVTVAQLFIYAVVVPLVIIIIFGLICSDPRHRFYITYLSAVGLIVSCIVTSVTTDILKNYIGRQRPDFIARCQPKLDANTTVWVYAKDVCTQTDMNKLKDGFRSTPSGHSLISFAGLFYLTLFLSGQFLIWDQIVGAWRTVLAAIPTLGALFIAISRTEDYRHHFVDVCIGGVIGILIACWSYYRVFPPVSSGVAHVPRIILAEQLQLEKRADDVRDGLYQSLEV